MGRAWHGWLRLASRVTAGDVVTEDAQPIVIKANIGIDRLFNDTFHLLSDSDFSDFGSSFCAFKLGRGLVDVQSAHISSSHHTPNPCRFD
jgi:hypothetical protein